MFATCASRAMLMCFRPSARSGTEASSALSDSRWYGKKWFIAKRANTFYSAESCSVFTDNKYFSIFNSATARTIARATRWNNIFWRIVKRIIVPMIGNKSIGEIALFPDMPSNKFSAPIARMRLNPDCIKQDCAGGRDKSCLSSKWVHRQITNAPMFCKFFFTRQISASL